MVGPEVKGPQSRQRDEFVAFAQVRFWPRLCENVLARAPRRIGFSIVFNRQSRRNFQRLIRFRSFHTAWALFDAYRNAAIR